MKKIILTTILLMTILILPSRIFSAQNKIYTLGVVPQFSPRVIQERWIPFVKYLSRETNVNIQLNFYKSIPEFEAAFLHGELDFAFMNPYHEVVAKKAQGYLPLIHDGSRKLVGILVVRQDSPIQSIQELDGQAVAFPAPNAFGASHYMRALLTEKEKIHIIPKYVKTHSNVYRHVILQEVSAGGGVRNTLAQQDVEIREKLRVLYETPGVTPHPLSAHPRVPQKLRASIIKAIIKLSNTGEGRMLLKKVQLTMPVKSNYQRDYQFLENLNLKKYWVETKK